MSTSSKSGRGSSRRQFIQTTVAGGAGLAIPFFLPRTTLWGSQGSPNRKINIAQIGCGRMGTEDWNGTIKHMDLCRIVAVCDLDQKRLETARADVEKFYQGKGESKVDIKAYRDYHEVLARKDIDAVIVTPPDHWHAIVVLEALLAGKDVHVQKPMTYDIAESIALVKAVRAKNRILQVGSQQRSAKPWNTFRLATEAVRNGRIGTIKSIQVGIGIDKPKGVGPKAQPVPATFDYETWLGPAPQQDYMEDRVHPQAGLGRPGWITTEDFGLGMITNWGAHHMDIALWGMGMELSGPTAIEGRADFMKNDVWTVHETYHIEMDFPNGVHLVMDDKFRNGVRFEGTNGWVFCARGSAAVTASDPTAGQQGDGKKSLDASDPKILTAPYGPNDKRWMASDDHYRNWLEAIVKRQDPIAPVDQAARSLQACAAGWIAMKTGKKLTWDPKTQAFVGDAAANAMCARKPRAAKYDIARIMKEAGL